MKVRRAKPKTGQYLPCTHCSKPIYIILSEVSIHKDHFCDVVCRQAWETSETKTVKCLQCHKDIRRPRCLRESRKTFCSKNCRDLFQRGRSNGRIPTGKIFKCAICGKDVYKHKCHTDNVFGKYYCSNECRLKDSSLLRKIYFSQQHIQTKPEKVIQDLILKYKLPYRYTGNGDFSVGRFMPDFVNTNGEKKLIEVNGCYWHNCPHCYPKQNAKDQDSKDQRKYATYKKFGWTPILLWEHELKVKNWENNVLLKIKE